VSTAAIFRIIEMNHPSLLIDEMDAVMHKETFEELRGILNSGHTRASANVIRTVGEDHEPRKFSTWCPMVYAAIGQLSKTLEDRSFIIRLQRKLPSESVKDWPITQGEELDALKTTMEELRRQCARWAEDCQATLTTVRVQRVPELDDRANNNWSTLLTVAEGIGGEWPEKARQAAGLISGTHTDNQTIGVQLLADTKEIFEEQKVEKISSQKLCEALEGREERPWATWRKGKPISQNNLARLLKPFEVSSKDIRAKSEGGKVLRGYEKEQFSKAWARYCMSPPENPVSKYDSATTPMNKGQTPVFKGATEEPCSTLDNGTFANTGAACSTVAVQKPEYGAKHTQPDLFDPKREGGEIDL